MSNVLNLGQVILFSLLDFIKIPPDLQVQPEIGRDIEESSQAERCAGRNASLLINQFINPLVRNMNSVCQFTLCNLHRTQKLF